jgi:hypothetical protein
MTVYDKQITDRRCPLRQKKKIKEKKALICLQKQKPPDSIAVNSVSLVSP